MPSAPIEAWKSSPYSSTFARKIVLDRSWQRLSGGHARIRHHVGLEVETRSMSRRVMSSTIPEAGGQALQEPDVRDGARESMCPCARGAPW